MNAMPAFELPPPDEEEEPEWMSRPRLEPTPADYPWPIPLSATADEVYRIRERQRIEDCRRAWEDQQNQPDLNGEDSEEQREARDHAERVRQGWDEGIGGWR